MSSYLSQCNVLGWQYNELEFAGGIMFNGSKLELGSPMFNPESLSIVQTAHLNIYLI